MASTRARVLATYLIDELKNLRSVVAIEQAYLEGETASEAVLSVLTWNHQLLVAIAEGERSSPGAGTLSANRRVLLTMAAVDEAAPRRAARLLLAANSPRATARFLAERIIAGPVQSDDAVQLVNLLPLVDQLAAHRPRGGGVSVDEPVAVLADEEALTAEEWPELRAAALAAIGAARHQMPIDDSEALLAHLGRHDPQVLAGWLRTANDPTLAAARLQQEMRHRHLLLSARAVMRDTALVAALEDAIAVDMRVDGPRLRQLALQYLEARAPAKLVAQGLARLPLIGEESPAGAEALLDVLMRAVRVQEEVPGDLRDIEALIDGDAVQVLGMPLARSERALRSRWAAFLLERRPEIVLSTCAALVETRADAFDLQLLGDCVQRPAAIPDEMHRGLALDALLYASRSDDEERQLLALRLLGEWNDPHAIAALTGRLESGQLPVAAAELCRLALLGRLQVEETQP